MRWSSEKASVLVWLEGVLERGGKGLKIGMYLICVILREENREECG